MDNISSSCVRARNMTHDVLVSKLVSSGDFLTCTCSTHIYTYLLSLFQQIGCDGIVGSDARLDHCGICSGDSSTCQIISGIFTRRYLSYGYNLISRIPAGACNINITEMGRSRNYLGKNQLS
jgi:hypothetical protein